MLLFLFIFYVYFAFYFSFLVYHINHNKHPRGVAFSDNGAYYYLDLKSNKLATHLKKVKVYHSLWAIEAVRVRSP